MIGTRRSALEMTLGARSIVHMSLPMKNLLPARFPLLMSLYEDNHGKLLRLLPQLRRIEGLWRSDVAGSPTLYCRIIAQEKHTTVALLSHQFAAPAQAAPAPADDAPLAYVRAYHDTRQAEVTHLREGSALRELFRADQQIQQLADQRLRLNLFFGKWLDFIGSCGHADSFSRVRSITPQRDPQPLSQRLAELIAGPSQS